MYKYALLVLFVSACLSSSIRNPTFEKDYGHISQPLLRQYKQQVHKKLDQEKKNQVHSGIESVTIAKAAVQDHFHRIPENIEVSCFF